MTEPSYQQATRVAYDTVAVDYAEVLRTELERKPLDRAMLGTFAELVQASGGGPVADLGSGPGRVTAYLHALGLSAFGIDLSPGMVAVARQAHRLSPDHVADLLSQAGLVVDARLLREPAGPHEKVRQAYIMVRKPG
jgi:SAM-dependent methyltransferase